jgi:uncharacterized protein (DUF1499 family)
MTSRASRHTLSFDQYPAAQSPFARYGLVLALITAVAALIAGLGNRFGWWHYHVSFDILKWAAYAGVAAALLSLIGAIQARPGGDRRGFVPALLGVLIGLAVFAGPAMMLRTARTVPPIHDITTDTANPPRFVAVLPLRAGAENTADYGGAELAAQQEQGYPQIQPVFLDVPPDVATARATAAARAMGWQIVAEVPAEGRVEATDTTLLFGFKDDVVIRVTPAGRRSRVDVRSVSRVGESDLGANARRIEAFMKKLAVMS